MSDKARKVQSVLRRLIGFIDGTREDSDSARNLKCQCRLQGYQKLLHQLIMPVARRKAGSKCHSRR